MVSGAVVVFLAVFLLGSVALVAINRPRANPVSASAPDSPSTQNDLVKQRREWLDRLLLEQQEEED